MTLTRREFIKHSGIAAGALVVTSAAPLPAWAEEKGGGKSSPRDVGER